MKISVEIVNAFIDGDVGGNLAGVVLDADNLSSEQKLQVAKLVGLSETAFISQSSIATVKLEFFTPERQIPHCGHATIAVFSRLSELGKISNGRMSKETIDGIREIIFWCKLFHISHVTIYYYFAYTINCFLRHSSI